MTGLIDYIQKPLDVLYARTSDETDTHGVYADTRSQGGVYSITSTQSDVSTYAATKTENNEDVSKSMPHQNAERADCEDPRTCPNCQPLAADD